MSLACTPDARLEKFSAFYGTTVDTRKICAEKSLTHGRFSGLSEFAHALLARRRSLGNAVK
jgi:hypothetical protein